MFKKKEVTINNKKAYYWEKNHSYKDTIVLLHGFPGNHKGLVDLANNLGDYRIIIPDLPACGESEPLEGKHNLENYSQWLNIFLNSLFIDKAIVIGHSFGSRVGLVFSHDFKERVERLVLITPVVKVEGLIAQFVSVEYKIAEMLPDYLKKAWLSNIIHYRVGDMIIYKSASPKRRKKLIDRRNQEIKNLKPQINIELFDEFYKFSLVPLGPKVKTKSLIIAGKEDEIAPLASIQELASQLANVTFVVMENCGHIVVGERPSTTASIIKKWFNQQPQQL